MPLGLDVESDIEPSEVILFAREDDPADTLSPRLQAAGADLSKIHVLLGITDGETDKIAPFSLRDVNAIRATLDDLPNVRCLIVDPIGGAVAGAGADSHKDAEVRNVMEPLAELAAEMDLVVICVAHTGKATDRKSAHKVLGSVAFVNLARIAFFVGRDEADPTAGYVCPIKCNLGCWPKSLKFQSRSLTPDEQVAAMNGYAVELDECEKAELARQLFRIEWLGTSDKTADDLDAKRPRESPKADEKARAAEWLRSFLENGAQPSDDCLAEGNKALNANHQLRWWREEILYGELKAKRAFQRERRWFWQLSDSEPSEHSEPSGASERTVQSAQKAQNLGDPDDEEVF